MAMGEMVYSDTDICLKCVDIDEVLYDEKGEFLDRIASSKLSFPGFEEVFRNLDKCQDVLLMCIKQRILLNEPVVRFHHKKDIADLQQTIHDKELSQEVNKVLQDTSLVGYKILKEANILDVLVEFDAERLANVVVFGKTLKMAGFFDMLAMVDESIGKGRILDRKNTKQTTKDIKAKAKNSNSKKNKMDPCKSDSIFEDIDSEDLDEIQPKTESILSSGSFGRAVVTVVLTARNYIPALDMYRQLLFSHLHTLSKFYLLVFHVGPLVEKQEVILYEYKIPKQIHKLLKKSKNVQQTEVKTDAQNENVDEDFQVCLTVKKTKFLGPASSEPHIVDTQHLNVNLLENEFRKFYGRRLQQLSPFKDYFRYIVYDCPGIKDHYKDKKARYERYVAKKERRREERRNERRIKEEESGHLEASVTEGDISKHVQVGSSSVFSKVNSV